MSNLSVEAKQTNREILTNYLVTTADDEKDGGTGGTGLSLREH